MVNQYFHVLACVEVRIFGVIYSNLQNSFFLVAAKNRCGAFDLSAIDCDQLPEKSEFCPGKRYLIVDEYFYIFLLFSYY